jgi:S-adenosyl-L-methionine hydrolase (adenosine-forming)
MRAPRLITLCTDFGLGDPGVAAMKGVILGIAPAATIVDVTHGVPAYDVRRGALELTRALSWFPPAIHVAVVDPGVGGTRRCIAIEVGRGDVLIGPDNGLFEPVAALLGGIERAYELTDPAYRLPDTTAVFHGRDVFAPAAAHLLLGVEPSQLGPPIPAGELAALGLPQAVRIDDELATAVLYVDSFGNVKLAGTAADLFAVVGEDPGRREVRMGERIAQLPWATTFGDVAVGDPFLFDDEDGRLCLACNQADASAVLGLAPDDPVVIRRAA